MKNESLFIYFLLFEVSFPKYREKIRHDVI